MKNMMWLGLVLVIVGGGLMIWGYIPYEEKHGANVMGMEMSVTTHEKKRIPVALSGTILGVGAAIMIISALKQKR